MTTDLQRAPARSLSENEEIITRGQRTFIEVGNALMEIREQRQYKDAGYSDFDTYCRERWGWTRRRAGQMIEAAGVVAQLEVGTIVPSHETQARPLAPLRSDPPSMREAWQDAQRIAAEREKPVTQAIVQEAVDARREDILRKAEQNREAAEALSRMTTHMPITEWISHHEQIAGSVARHESLPQTSDRPTEAELRQLDAVAITYERMAGVIRRYMKESE